MYRRTASPWRWSTALTFIGGVALAAVCFAVLPQGPSAKLTPPETKVFAPRQVSSFSREDVESLRALDTTLANLAEFVSPGVVHIKSETATSRSDLMGNRLPVQGGQGSGVIYRPDGYIVTNDHVVGGYDKVTVVLQDGRELPGEVMRAQDVDIAVVKIDAKDLPTLPFGDSHKVRPGQISMAVGSPFGLQNTVTVGHISAVGRVNAIQDPRISTNGGYRDYPELIQTDTPINVGNSGGPLVNIEGQVIGINTAIFSTGNPMVGGGGSSGIGFAIPSNTARLIADRLINKEKVERGAIGVVPESVKQYQQRQLGIEGGARVARVENGTPGALAGLKQGDVILRIGSLPIRSESDLRNAMFHYKPGETVEFEVLRDGQRKTLKITLTSIDKLPRTVQPQPRRDEDDEDGVFRFGPEEFSLPDLERLRERFERQGQGRRNDGRYNLRLNEDQARLGVTVEDVTEALRDQFKLPKGSKGVVVTTVQPGSVGEKIGLAPGDIIRSIRGRDVANVAELMKVMEDAQWGDSATIRIQRFKGSDEANVVQREFTFERD